MLRRCLASSLVVAILALATGRVSAQQPAASCSTCSTFGGLGLTSSLFGGRASSLNSNVCNTCQHFFCPTYKYCQEGAPIICIERGCPKPVCNPCNAPNWGYYQTCWTPWPWPQDYSHCPVLPPAAVVVPGMVQNPVAASVERGQAPRRANGL